VTGIGSISPINEEFLIAIGKVAYRMAHLESFTTNLLAKMMGGDVRLAKNMSAGSPPSVVFHVLESAFYSKSVPEKQKTDFTGLLKRLRDIHKERNEFIHGLYFFPDKSGNVIRQRPIKKSPITSTQDEMGVGDVEPFIGKINKLTGDIYTFGNKYYGDVELFHSN